MVKVRFKFGNISLIFAHLTDRLAIIVSNFLISQLHEQGIYVSRGQDSFRQLQESRPLAGPEHAENVHFTLLANQIYQIRNPSAGPTKRSLYILALLTIHKLPYTYTNHITVGLFICVIIC